MIFESKYEVGQRLWEIQLNSDTDLEKCPCCGEIIFTNKRWEVIGTEFLIKIRNVHIQDGSVYYQIYRPPSGVYREMLQESEIGQTFFTSEGEARKKCEEENAKLEKEKSENRERRYDLFLELSKRERKEKIIRSTSNGNLACSICAFKYRSFNEWPCKACLDRKSFVSLYSELI